MKGYKAPERINRGICFICSKPCNPEAYAHDYCAIAYNDAKQDEINKAVQEALTHDKTNKEVK